MSRTVEKGLGYIPVDVNILSDRKIRRLRRRVGDNAPYVYIALLLFIAKEGYYVRWDDDAILDVADSIGYNEEFIAEAVSACIEVGLFSKDMYDSYGIITSHGIQKQYEQVKLISKSKARVNEYSLLNTSEGIAINTEENAITSEENAFHSEVQPQIKVNKSKEKKIKENSSSSFIPSSPVGEELTQEEKEKEKFIYFFTFVQNFKDPGYEYERMVAYNNNPQAKKKWDRFTEKEKQSVLMLWHPEKESVQDHQKRFGEQFLSMWQALFRKLQEARAPYEVRMAALADGVRWAEKADSLILYIPEILREYLEQYMDTFKPVIWPFLQLRGCSKLMYDRC